MIRGDSQLVREPIRALACLYPEAVYIITAASLLVREPIRALACLYPEAVYLITADSLLVRELISRDCYYNNNEYS